MPICQICGRDIKAKRGVIAHHGYTRPQEGWQTSSCPGALWKPFDVSRDRLGWWLTVVEQRIKDTIKLLTDHTTAPYPEKLIARVRVNPWDRFQTNKDVDRPEGFVPPTPGQYSYASEHSYEKLWKARQWELTEQLKRWEGELKYQTERYNSWKPDHKKD